MVYCSEHHWSDWKPSRFDRRPRCHTILWSHLWHQGRTHTMEAKEQELERRFLGEKRGKWGETGQLPFMMIITISEFSMKRQQVESNGKYADVCKWLLDASPRGPVGELSSPVWRGLQSWETWWCCVEHWSGLPPFIIFNIISLIIMDLWGDWTLMRSTNKSFW